ncbi:MAG TPA: nucleotidyltransferase domain-containing protein, partial [Propionibacteriaceae bacterium]|nr:nucleotidyltransferase domain-containing protein [Propionibacteriaceae bacterium]
MGEQQAVLDFFIERLRRAEGVALAAVYGSFGTPAQSETSDVDIFFVPSTPDGAAASMQVIVDGVGYDLWPVSWARLERIADLT